MAYEMTVGLLTMRWQGVPNQCKVHKRHKLGYEISIIGTVVLAKRAEGWRGLLIVVHVCLTFLLL